MEYDKRFTQRVVLKDDALGEGLSYTSKAKQEVLTIRLGLYEDLFLNWSKAQEYSAYCEHF